MNWIFWLVLVLFLALIELSTVNLITIWFVASGLASLLLSFFTDNNLITFSVFVLLGVLLLLISKPLVKKLKTKAGFRTNLGMDALVTEDITKNVIGEVKVDGKRWSATSIDECHKGDIVKVKKIEGVKLIVKKESD